MKQILSLFALFFLLLPSGCQQEKEKGVETLPADGKISSIIRNPVSANKVQDTVNVAKMTFTEKNFDFGTVKQGEKVTHVFEFTNTGRIPLLISDARSTCGCTVPEWPHEAIPPGEKGSIKVVFNTAGKHDQQRKPVTITANTYPSETVIQLTGFVEADDQ